MCVGGDLRHFIKKMYEQPVEQETGYCGMWIKYNVFIQ